MFNAIKAQQHCEAITFLAQWTCETAHRHTAGVLVLVEMRIRICFYLELLGSSWDKSWRHIPLWTAFELSKRFVALWPVQTNKTNPQEAYKCGILISPPPKFYLPIKTFSHVHVWHWRHWRDRKKTPLLHKSVNMVLSVKSLWTCNMVSFCCVFWLWKANLIKLLHPFIHLAACPASSQVHYSQPATVPILLYLCVSSPVCRSPAFLANKYPCTPHQWLCAACAPFVTAAS